MPWKILNIFAYLSQAKDTHIFFSNSYWREFLYFTQEQGLTHTYVSEHRHTLVSGKHLGSCLELFQTIFFCIILVE